MHSLVNIAETCMEGTQPAQLILKTSTETDWYVVDGSIRLDTPPRWLLTRSGGHVRIPIQFYLVVADAASAMAFATSLVSHAMIDLQRRVHAKMLSYHLSFADKVEQVDTRGVIEFRVGMGLAIEVERKHSG